MDITLHLVTQDNQPFGSVRKCCEKCGQMVGNITYTDDKGLYENPPTGGPKYTRCSN